MLTEYIVDAAELAWRRGETEGVTYNCQVMLSGEDGGPEALRFQFDPCPKMYAHMHLVSQFQLLLGGSMDLPKESMKLRPIGVHYTDHARPYGPFATGPGHDVLVLHPRQGGLVTMADKDARRQINIRGRELSAMDSESEWFSLPGSEAVRYKVLIPSSLGPEVVIFEFPPDTPVTLAPPTYGRYEVVRSGSVSIGGRTLGPPSLRYVLGDEQAAPLLTGPEGATLIFLSFDADALEGGLVGGLAEAAAEALSKAL